MLHLNIRLLGALLLVLCCCCCVCCSGHPTTVTEEEVVNISSNSININPDSGINEDGSKIIMNVNSSAAEEDLLLVELEFSEFEAAHSKVYNSIEEREYRKSIFVQNRDWINTHNAKNLSWTAAINQFGDWTWEEFQQVYFGDDDGANGQSCTDNVKSNNNNNGDKKDKNGMVPDRINWLDLGKVTPAPTQGKCDCSWAFAAAGVLESAKAIKLGTLMTFSAQQLIDCSDDFGNNGCKGGLPSQALEYVAACGGINTNDIYRYLGKEGKCHFQPASVAASVVSVVNITQNDETGLQVAVGTVGPVAVSLNVVVGFQFYKNGVYIDSSCATSLGPKFHAVLAVGYDYDELSGHDYWIMKNSWGPTWGLNGFFWILRGANECVLASCASYALI